MLEVELKAYAENHDEIKRKIIEIGGSYLKAVRESDSYFGHPSRDFGRTDEALRIRSEDSKIILTYKGPKIGERTKTRYEIETGIADAGAMREILTRLGFIEVDTVTKRREIYLYNGIEICLDRVEDVGDFVELEKRAEEREEAEDELFSLAASLGLARFERRSYLELKLEKK